MKGSMNNLDTLTTDDPRTYDLARAKISDFDGSGGLRVPRSNQGAASNGQLADGSSLDTGRGNAPVKAAGAAIIASPTKGPAVDSIQPRDKYDLAMDYLRAHPEEIKDAWSWPFHPARCLFEYVTPHPSSFGTIRPDWEPCGCLTMIRMNLHWLAWTDELTAEIQADLSIPNDVKDITTHHLPIFAKWQRIIDRRLNRV